MPSAADRRFTVPEDVLLAGCVSKHRCLYDKDHMYHGNWKIKERLWAEIAKTLDRSVVGMRGPHTPPGSPPPSPIPEEEEEEGVSYDGGRYCLNTVGIRGPHTPPGSPPPSPILEEGEIYSGRQVMAQLEGNTPAVVVASQNPSPDTEGFTSGGQIATQMTPRMNQICLPVNQPSLKPTASGSFNFHGRPESSRSQNRDERRNGPPWRPVKHTPQQYRGTKHEYRSPSNLRKRKEERHQLKDRKKMLKQQVIQPTYLKRDNSHAATNQTFSEPVAYTPTVPTTSSATAGTAPQTPEERIDDTGSAFQGREVIGEPFEQVGQLKPRE